MEKYTYTDGRWTCLASRYFNTSIWHFKSESKGCISNRTSRMQPPLISLNLLVVSYIYIFPNEKARKHDSCLYTITYVHSDLDNPILSDSSYRDIICLRKLRVAIGHRAFNVVADHHFFKMIILINSWKINFSDKKICIPDSGSGVWCIRDTFN